MLCAPLRLCDDAKEQYSSEAESGLQSPEGRREGSSEELAMRLLCVKRVGSNNPPTYLKVL